jgi:hypothetical protein
MIKDSVLFTNLLSADDEPDWKVARYPFTDAGAVTIATMKPGYVVKFDALRSTVYGALPADDAAMEAIIVDLPDNTDVPTGTANKTVAVALNGSFDKNQIKYADGTSPLSTAAVTRLRTLGIFLDPATPAGSFAP